MATSRAHLVALARDLAYRQGPRGRQHLADALERHRLGGAQVLGEQADAQFLEQPARPDQVRAASGGHGSCPPAARYRSVAVCTSVIQTRSRPRCSASLRHAMGDAGQIDRQPAQLGQAGRRRRTRDRPGRNCSRASASGASSAMLDADLIAFSASRTGGEHGCAARLTERNRSSMSLADTVPQPFELGPGPHRGSRSARSASTQASMQSSNNAAVLRYGLAARGEFLGSGEVLLHVGERGGGREQQHPPHARPACSRRLVGRRAHQPDGRRCAVIDQCRVGADGVAALPGVDVAVAACRSPRR